MLWGLREHGAVLLPHHRRRLCLLGRCHRGSRRPQGLGELLELVLRWVLYFSIVAELGASYAFFLMYCIYCLKGLSRRSRRGKESAFQRGVVVGDKGSHSKKSVGLGHTVTDSISAKKKYFLQSISQSHFLRVGSRLYTSTSYYQPHQYL